MVETLNSDNNANKKINSFKKFTPATAKEYIDQDAYNDDQMIKDIDKTDSLAGNKIEVDDVFLTKEIWINFNTYIEEVVADIKKESKGIEGKIFDIDEMESLIKTAYGKLLWDMVTAVQTWKHTEIYPSILSTFENAFNQALEDKLSWASWWLIKQMANKKDFEASKTKIKSTLSWKINGMLLRTLRPLKLKIQKDNPETATTITSLYEDRSTYRDGKKEEFFKNIFNKVETKLF